LTVRSTKFGGLLIVVLATSVIAACRRDAPPETEAGRATTPSGRSPAPVAADSYGLRPAERAAVEAFLKAHTDLRLSSDADARAAEPELIRLYGVYHPFFLRGDVNDDGLMDVVTAFIRRDSPTGTPWFSVVVFAGRAGGGFDGGTFLERDISLANGDLSIDRDSIIVTPDTSDDPNRRYRWDAVRKQFALVSDDDEAPETPPVTRTKSRAPGVEFRVWS
jgi:hypothetical protein